MPLKKSRWLLPAVCISLLAAGSAARAEEKTSIDPRAERILKAALGTISAAKSYMFRGETTTEGQLPGGQRLEYAGTVQGAVRRPDHAWVRVENEEVQRTNWYDGKTFAYLDVGANAYATWPAPPTINELFDKLGEKFGFVPPMAPMMRQLDGKTVLKNAKSGFYVGEAVVRGSACSHLFFSQENNDWELWIDNVVPLIRRMVITYKKLPGTPKYAVTFTDWDFNATLPDFVFAFDPPRGATRAEFEIVNP
jgi:hypothetical protein